MLVMNHLPWFNDCLASVGLPETCQLEQQFGAAKVGTSVSYVSLITWPLYTTWSNQDRESVL